MVYIYDNLFDPHFTFSGSIFHRIWSKGGNFLFTKSKQTLGGGMGQEKESNTVKGATS